MKIKYKLNLTPFALCNTIIMLFIAVFFYIGVIWVVSNVSLNGGLVTETYFNNKKPLIIISESMEPTIMTNSLLIVSNIPYSEIQHDDIILIDTAEHGLVIHRAIEETSIGFITKGDNNEYPDNWVVTEDMYKGKVVAIHNEVASVITFLFGDFTQIKSFRLLAGFLILALIITGIILIGNWFYDYIYITLFLRKSVRKGNIKQHYFKWIDHRVTDSDIDEVIEQLSFKRTFIDEILFRYRVMKWYNAIKEEEKQVKRVAKRYTKMKGVYRKW